MARRRTCVGGAGARRATARMPQQSRRYANLLPDLLPDLLLLNLMPDLLLLDLLTDLLPDLLMLDLALSSLVDY